MNLYTEEHLAIIQSTEKLIATEINPFVDKWEEEEIFPAHDVFKKLADAGFLGIDKPESYGGSELPFSYTLAFFEALGEVDCVGITIAVGVQVSMATPALAAHGSPELCEEFLRPSISGDYVACIGVSEPNAGSDVSQIKTTARREGDDYVIDGGKMWITNGTQADWMCVLVNTSEGPTHKTKSLICLPLDTPGVTIARKLDKLGLRSSDTAQIFFDGVRVPVRNRIGEEGKGFVYQMEQFQEERMVAAAISLRPMEKAIADVIEYTSSRQAFGRRVIDNQVVRFRLAELQTEVEMLRSLLYRAAMEQGEGNDATVLASMAKLKSGRLSRVVADACLHYYGGMGFMNENPITRFHRDCQVFSIGGGTDEIMLEIISKKLGMLG